MKSVFYVGMDVHKESVRIAVLKGTEKQTVYEAVAGQVNLALLEFEWNDCVECPA